jgi:hypothetical protein
MRSTWLPLLIVVFVSRLRRWESYLQVIHELLRLSAIMAMMDRPFVNKEVDSGAVSKKKAVDKATALASEG